MFKILFPHVFSIKIIEVVSQFWVPGFQNLVCVLYLEYISVQTSQI